MCQPLALGTGDPPLLPSGPGNVTHSRRVASSQGPGGASRPASSLLLPGTRARRAGPQPRTSRRAAGSPSPRSWAPAHLPTRASWTWMEWPGRRTRGAGRRSRSATRGTAALKAARCQTATSSRVSDTQRVPEAGGRGNEALGSLLLLHCPSSCR